MNKLVAVTIMSLTLTSCARVSHEIDGPVVLPNYALLGCKSVSCPEVWQGKPAAANTLYPNQITIDIDNTSNRGVMGVMATYDKSVSMQDITLSIDRRYGKWAFPKNSTSPVKLWRVEPEKFAIQLSEDDGVKYVIYMAFAPNNQVFEDWVKSGAFGSRSHGPQATPGGSEQAPKTPCGEK